MTKEEMIAELKQVYYMMCNAENVDERKCVALAMAIDALEENNE